MRRHARAHQATDSNAFQERRPEMPVLTSITCFNAFTRCSPLLFWAFKHVGRRDEHIPMVQLLCPPHAFICHNVFLRRSLKQSDPWGFICVVYWQEDVRTRPSVTFDYSSPHGKRWPSLHLSVADWPLSDFSLLLSMHISLCGCVWKVSRWSHCAADACSQSLNQNMDFAMMSAFRMCYICA